jgi:AcrR family transcriptional regulator
MTTDLRERTRRAVREEVAAQAWLLFAEHGFEGTTVDEIAAAAGMSRRSFFRYFASKENLLLEGMLEAGQVVVDAFAARPAEEPVWQALRRAYQPMVEQLEDQSDHVRALTIMLREPGLRAALQERRVRLEAALVPLIAERLSGTDDVTLRAAAIAGASFACWDAAQQQWADRPGSNMGDLADTTFAALRTA